MTGSIIRERGEILQVSQTVAAADLQRFEREASVYERMLALARASGNIGSRPATDGAPPRRCVVSRHMHRAAGAACGAARRNTRAHLGGVRRRPDGSRNQRRHCAAGMCVVSHVCVRERGSARAWCLCSSAHE